MGKIDEQAGRALLERQKFSGGNTVVMECFDIPNRWMMVLHGTPIARVDRQYGLALSSGSYPSNTTQSRLNGILDATPEDFKVRIKGGEMFIQNGDDAKKLYPLGKDYALFSDIREFFVKG